MSTLPVSGQWRTKFLDSLMWPLGAVFFVILIINFYIAINITVEIFSKNTPDYIKIIPALGPPTIGLGVLIAWISFLSNQRHKQEDVSRETSAFFYNECTRKLENIVSTFSDRLSNDNWMHNIQSNVDDSGWKNILSDLSDALVMWRHVSHNAYRQAFSIRWTDIQKLLLQKLGTLTLFDCIRLPWGGDLRTIEEKIDSYNQNLKEDLLKPDVGRNSEARSKAVPRDVFTPFPSGISAVTLKKLIFMLASPIDKAGEYDENIVNFYIAANKLDVLKQYFYACSSYQLDNGLILRTAKKQ